MSRSSYEKMRERRALVFLSESTEPPMSILKETIDAYFDEDERTGVYACAMDVITGAYPFDGSMVNMSIDQINDIVKQLYGIEPTDFFLIDRIMTDIKNEKDNKTTG